MPDFLKVAREKKAWWFSAFENGHTIASIKRAVDYLQLDKPVILLQNPMAIGAVRSIDHSLFSFDAIDNWLFHPQMTSNHERVEKGYQYVQENADVIFTVSQSLCDFFNSRGKAYWIPNGVDPEFFAPARRSYDGGKITVGYTGKIQDRVDFDLVEQCLKQYPDVDFVFAGPVYSQKGTIDRLDREYSNIRFLGDIQYDKLPFVMKDFDITIIPHKVDSFTASMNPLKLYEYLAAGKPVLSTNVAGTSDISRYVHIAESSHDFVEELGVFVLNVKSGKIDAQLVSNSIPEKFTWSHQSAEIIKLMETVLKN
ncbi:glycosyltransferase [Bifidobacterium amazonense]|uniref:Glycosyltransferase n=1 Tax=Bifidobacterium amazonense TaxID=2809027 RepID=A0ABS9VXL5_9BIFI|nr:glycosyltransferase [Bifidobacterium amazonense]MCH9276852.1 glycosyltransferase [Bifidobacterium amazonense]